MEKEKVSYLATMIGKVKHNIHDYVSSSEIEEIGAVLKDDQIKLTEKVLLIEKIEEKEEEFSEAEILNICEMCIDEQYDSQLRSRLISLIPDDSENCMDMLNVLLSDDEASIVSRAISKLYEIDNVAATDLAYSKIADYTSEAEEVVSTSLNIVMRAVDEGLFNSAQMLSKCELILEDNSNSQYLRKSAGYTLASVKSMEALEIVLNSDIDELVKTACVEQNFPTMLSCLNKNPSRKDVEVIIKAMDVLPLTEVIDMLNEVAIKYNLDVSYLKEMESCPGNLKTLGGMSVQEYLINN